MNASVPPTHITPRKHTQALEELTETVLNEIGLGEEDPGDYPYHKCHFEQEDGTWAYDNEQARLVEPGARLTVLWQSEEEGHRITDEGYLFTLPGLEPRDVWLGGVVHVPNPWGELGPIEPAYLTLGDLLRNELVESVRFYVKD